MIQIGPATVGFLLVTLFFPSVTPFLQSIFSCFCIQNAPALATHNLAVLYLAYLVLYRLMKINSLALDQNCILVLALQPQHSVLSAKVSAKVLIKS